MRLLFKLLRKNTNLWQMGVFALANLVGAVIVLVGIQAYRDAGQVLKAPDSVMKNNFLVISKPVSTMTTIAGSLGAGPRSFSEKEIQEIASLEGVKSVATFRTALFPVYGGVSFGGISASTEMFVESVPDEFLDVDPKIWTASINEEFVPVVIPRTYLNFYNYGFAASRGTPQLGEDLFSKVPLRLIFSGPDTRRRYTGKIVGLSERMNTILVPDGFLEEANKLFAVEEPKKPTRVILEADVDASAELMEYIDSKGYVIDGGGEDTVRLLSVVRTIISILVALGLLVSALSFFLLLVSILLLVEKNRYKNETLHQLGYPAGMIALPYQALALGVDVLVWLAATLITFGLYPLLSGMMQTLTPDFIPAGPWLVILSGVGFCLLFAITHVLVIRHKIRSR